MAYKLTLCPVCKREVRGYDSRTYQCDRCDVYGCPCHGWYDREGVPLSKTERVVGIGGEAK